MAYEQKPGDFTLFPNDKQGNERRPDYTGKGLALDGTPVRVSAWKKQGQRGEFLSCRFEVAQQQAAPQPQAAPQAATFDGDDIPF
jgi:hypothetical protein